MAIPVVTPISPLAGSANQSTNQPVVLQVTSATNTVQEGSIRISVAGVPALSYWYFPGDGAIQQGQNKLVSVTHPWEDADVGRAVFIVSLANPRNDGKAYISAVSAAFATVLREDLVITANVTNGLNTVTTSAPYGLTIQLGDSLSFDRGATVYQVAALTGAATFKLDVNYAGTTDLTAAITPSFHTTDGAVDWTLHGFADGFTGTIVPVANGYEATIWPVRELAGTVSSDGAGNLAGIGSAFLAELDDGASFVLAGHKTNESLAAITSISNDVAAVTGVYRATGYVTGWRTSNLPGLPASQETITITCEAEDEIGQVAAPASYTFTTMTRPKVLSANGPDANPFGYGLRVFFSENLLPYNGGTNPAIHDTRTWTVTAISPRPGQPMPADPTITGVTTPAGNPSYVDFAFAAAMQNGATYRVLASNMALRASSGVLLADSPYLDVDFTGYGPAEIVEAFQDTTARAPIIETTQRVDYGTPPVLVEIRELDPDIVAIQLGTSSVNATIVPGSFVNNVDGPIVGGVREAGTGTFLAALSPLATSYRIAIEVIDDVDNISLESNVVAITANPASIPGTAVQIRPYDAVNKATCDRLLADIPQGTAWVEAGFVVPYTYDPYPFTLKVVEKGQPVKIVVSRESQPGAKNVPTITTFIPENLSETVFITLGQGRNFIVVDDGERRDFIIVTASIYATILCSISSEIFTYAELPLQDIQRSIFSEVSTRIADPYLPYSDILPLAPVRSQQTLSTKLAIRSQVGDVMSARSVRDVIAAVSMQTPFIEPTPAPKQRFWPGVARLLNAQQNFGGFAAHTWFPSECVTRWSSYLAYMAAQPSRYIPQDVSEDEIIVRDQYGVFRRHTFDLSDASCSSITPSRTCFEDILLQVLFDGSFTLPFCAAQYPFDSCFTYEYPLGGRATFDSLIPWDSGDPLDQDYLDPGHDGWVGLCWTDRWDGGHPLDSMGGAPDYAVETQTADGQTQAGQSSFTSVAYTFTGVDVGRNLRILNSASGLLSLIVLEVLSPNSVKCAVAAGLSLFEHFFDLTETNLDWELWDDSPPNCVWDGYANLVVNLASADISIDAGPTVVVQAALDHDPPDGGGAGVSSNIYMTAVLLGDATITDGIGVWYAVEADMLGEATITVEASTILNAEATFVGDLDIWVGTEGGSPAPISYMQASLTGEAWTWVDTAVTYVTSATLTGEATISADAIGGAVYAAATMTGDATITVVATI